MGLKCYQILVKTLTSPDAQYPFPTGNSFSLGISWEYGRGRTIKLMMSLKDSNILINIVIYILYIVIYSSKINIIIHLFIFHALLFYYILFYFVFYLIVALCSVILVCLLIVGSRPRLKILSMKNFVLSWFSDFKRSMLKSTESIIVYFHH